MSRCSNKIKKLFFFLMTAKLVMLLILIFCIIDLDGWKKEAFVAVTEDQSQNNGKILLAKAASSIKPINDMEMTAKRNNTEKKYRPIILEAAYRYKVEPAIIKAIIMAESGFNPKAVSKVGARGLMQLMPRTARSLGVEDSFKPSHNIDAGVRYFKQLLDQFDGNIELALAAYNAGSFNVRKYGGIPPFKETKFYIHKVLKYYEVYRTT